jgi:uncharacterized UBP type Zn finger protein
MSKKCVYCNCQINDERAIDCCDRCGYGVWGEKMFNAIRKNMDDAKDRGEGDLFSSTQTNNILGR